MTKEIEIRLQGQEFIFQSLYYNSELSQHLIFLINREFPEFRENFALRLLIKNSIESQILEFYKLLKTEEKFSFQKILNIAKNSKLKINYSILENKIKELNNHYVKSEFETIRSKYIAHQDLNTLSLNTDQISLSKFNLELENLFSLFCKIFNKEISSKTDICKSVDKIFNKIRSLEEINALCFATELKKGKSVKLSELDKIINKSSS